MKNPIQKFKSMPQMLKVTIVFAAASFATSGINYITTPIFTRLLTQKEYGLVSVYNSWYSIIQVFASMTLIFPGILNVGLYDHRENMWKYLSSLLGITTACSSILAVFYLIFRMPIQVYMDLPASLLILMLLSCFLLPATTFWTFLQRYTYSYRIAFIVSVGSALLAQAAAVLGVVLAKNHTSFNLGVVRLWSAGLVNLLVALILFALICYRGKKFIHLSLWRATIIVAIPLIPHYLGSVALTATDKIMISQMIGTDKAGIYALAAVLSAIGVLLWRALSITFAPFVNTKLGQRSYEEIREAVKPLLIMVGILCIIASFAAPELIRVLAGSSYLSGLAVVPPVAAGIFIHALYDVFSAISFFHKKSLNIMMATLTAAGCNILLNFIFIPYFGFVAAGYTTLFSNLILTLLHFINARLIIKEPVYDGRFSFILLSLITFGCLLANLVYSYLAIRIVIIAGLSILMVMMARPLVRTLVKMKV